MATHFRRSALGYVLGVSALFVIAALFFSRYKETDTVGPAWTDGYLQKNAAQTFRVSLKAHQAYRLEVWQCGLNVAVHLQGYPGKRPLVIDNPVGGNATEKFVWIASRDATYTLVVQASNSDSLAGPFALRLVHLGPATQADRLLSRAYEALYRGYAAGQSGKSEHNQKAALHYREAHQSFVALGEYQLATDCLIYLSRIDSSQGNIASAIATGMEALVYLEQDQDTYKAAVTGNSLGLAFYRAQRYREALPFFHYYRRGMAQADDLVWLANAYNNIGRTHALLGESDMARAYYQKALDLLQAGGDIEVKAMTMRNMAGLYLRNGDGESALNLLLPALEIAKKNSDYVGWIWRSTGNAFQKMGDLEAAQDLYRRAIQSARRGVNPTMLQLLQVRYAATFVQLEDFDTAKKILEDITEGTKGGQKAYALYWLARAYAGHFSNRLADDDFETAFSLLEQAYQLALALEDMPLQADCRFWQGRLLSQCGGEALVAYQQALALLEQRRKMISDPKLRARLLDSRYHYYHEAALAALDTRQQNPKRALSLAFSFSEQARARVLLDKIFGTATPKPIDIEGNEHFWDQTLGSLQSLWVNFTPSDSFSQEPKSPSEPLQLGFFEQKTLLTDLQAVLKPDEVYIALSSGQDESLLWTVDAQQVHCDSLPGLHPLQRALEPLQQSANDPNATPPPKSPLSLLLTNRLKDEHRKIILSQDGTMNRIPIELFLGNPLPDGRSVRYVPSTAAMITVRQKSRIPELPGRIAIFADPLFQGNLALNEPQPVATLRSSRPGEALPPLPQTRMEAQAIARLAKRSFWDVTSFFGPDATKKQFLAHAPTSQILHLATHGASDHRFPDQDRLYFSTGQTGQIPPDVASATLTSAEILGLNLNTRLVVLSACQTALGEQIRGEGMQSLARAMLMAGSRAVVATLWQIPDDVAAAFSIEFYKAYLGQKQSLDMALAHAKRAVAAHPAWQHPYYWSGFILLSRD